MILHIPHANRTIPEDLRPTLLLDDDKLEQELIRMTDAYTDELFKPLAGPGDTVITFPVSRLVVDPERFRDDVDEPMAQRGMGAVYTKTSDGDQLRDDLSPADREDLMQRFYDPHHKALEEAVRQELAHKGGALIVDCHSFPSSPLPCDQDQADKRPHICIGTDSVHSPQELVDALHEACKAPASTIDKWTVRINEPYAGTLVPTRFYQQDERVISVMIEVNRSLYMDEQSGKRKRDFDRVMFRLLSAIRKGFAAFFLRSGTQKLADIDEPTDDHANNPIDLGGKSFWSSIGLESDVDSSMSLCANVDMNHGWSDEISALDYPADHDLIAMQDVSLLFQSSRAQEAWDAYSTDYDLQHLLTGDEREEVRRVAYLKALGVEADLSEAECWHRLSELQDELKAAGADHLDQLVRLKSKFLAIKLAAKGEASTTKLDMQLALLAGSLQRIYSKFEAWINQLLVTQAELWPDAARKRAGRRNIREGMRDPEANTSRLTYIGKVALEAQQYGRNNTDASFRRCIMKGMADAERWCMGEGNVEAKYVMTSQESVEDKLREIGLKAGNFRDADIGALLRAYGSRNRQG